MIIASTYQRKTCNVDGLIAEHAIAVENVVYQEDYIGILKKSRDLRRASSQLVE